MTKSQFNIKISKELLTQIKRQATKSGKTLTEHITDLISKSLSENDLQDIDSYSAKQIKDFEERLLDIESIVSLRAENCCDYAVSLTLSRNHPDWMFKIDSTNKIKPLIDQKLKNS